MQKYQYFEWGSTLNLDGFKIIIFQYIICEPFRSWKEGLVKLYVNLWEIWRKFKCRRSASGPHWSCPPPHSLPLSQKNRCFPEIPQHHRRKYWPVPKEITSLLFRSPDLKVWKQILKHAITWSRKTFWLSVSLLSFPELLVFCLYSMILRPRKKMLRLWKFHVSFLFCLY